MRSVFDAFTYRTVNRKSVKPLLCMNNEPDKSSCHIKGGSANEMQSAFMVQLLRIRANQSTRETLDQSNRS